MNNLRKCVVNGNSAYFHRWSDKSQIIDPSPFVGGHNGGVLKHTVGIVEFEDGTVHECYPNEVIFIDRQEIKETKETKEPYREYKLVNRDVLNMKPGNMESCINERLIMAGFDLKAPIEVLCDSDYIIYRQTMK